MPVLSSSPSLSTRISELAQIISLALLGLATFAILTLLTTSPAALMVGGHFMYGGYMPGGFMLGGFMSGS